MSGSSVAADSTFWIALVALVALVVGGSGAVFWARRMLRGPVPGPPPAFTLENLREMLDRGELTQREYDTARDALLHRTGQMDRSERAKRGGTDWSGPDSGTRPAR